MWQNAKEEKNQYKRNQILKDLKDILSLQPLLSNYYEATNDVMKDSEYMKRYYNPEFEASRNDAANSKDRFILTKDEINK